MTTKQWLKSFVKTYEPGEPGLVIKRITSLLMEPDAFSLAVDLMSEPFLNTNFDYVIAPEADGFTFATAIALKFNKGMIGLKKYDPVYYSSRGNLNLFDIPEDSHPKAGDKLLLVDDVLATGDTIKGCLEALERFEVEVVGVSVFVEIMHRKGREALSGVKIYSVLEEE